MSMIDESELQQMHRLGRSGLPRDLEDVRRRAREIRRRRRSTRAGLTAVVVLAVAGVTASGVVPLPGRGESLVALKPAPLLGEAPPIRLGQPLPEPARLVMPEPTSRIHAEGCVGYSAKVGPDALGTLPRLPASPPSGLLLQGAFARLKTKGNCLTVPMLQGAAVDLADDGASVSKALAVWGPDAEIPNYSSHELDAVSRTIDPIRMRNSQGRLDMAESVGQASLTWTEPSGQQWVATSSGLSAKELVAAVKALQIEQNVLDTTSLPHLDASAGARPEVLPSAWWLLQYTKADAPDDGSLDIEIDDARGTTPLLAMATLAAARSVHFADVYGNRALLTSERNGGHTFTWDTAEGYQGRASGFIPPAEMLTVARSLTPVQNNDPRLEGKDPK